TEDAEGAEAGEARFDAALAKRRCEVEKIGMRASLDAIWFAFRFSRPHIRAGSAGRPRRISPPCPPCPLWWRGSLAPRRPQRRRVVSHIIHPHEESPLRRLAECPRRPCCDQRIRPHRTEGQAKIQYVARIPRRRRLVAILVARSDQQEERRAAPG